MVAAREHGIITYIKHFALNDSETHRAKGICTWTTEQALRAGTDKMMPASMDGEYWDDESAGTIRALRNAAHNYLYALANSNAVDVSTGTPTWLIVLEAVDAAVIILLAVWEVIAVRRFLRAGKNNKNTKEK